VKQATDDAYVLGTNELGEADLLVTLLAENAGQVRGVAASARRSRRRFGGALEPLTRVRARWVEKEGRELARIASLDLVRSYAAMQSDPAKLAACAVLAELARATTREGQADPGVFRLLGAVLEALERGTDPWVVVRYFEYWLLRLLGVLGDLGSCSRCGRPLARNAAWVSSHGQLRCSRCSREGGGTVRKLTAGAWSFLDAARRLPPAATDPHRGAARPGGCLEALLRGALEAFAERRFRTYRHLEAMTA
jgi:DNA repair protein RecO (recombination protein O)